MQRLKKSLGMLGVAALVGALPDLSVAREPVQGPQPQRARAASVAEPAIDPAIRALVVGLAASLLREAAASPDPATALGEALERKLLLALRSPEISQLIDGMIGHAAKEAPAELREPIALFAVAMLNSLRREMLEDVRPRGRH